MRIYVWCPRHRDPLDRGGCPLCDTAQDMNNYQAWRDQRADPA